MQLLKSFNLALAFGLELCLLVAVGYWGVTVGPTTLLKLVLGLGAPVIIAVIWGVFMAPASAQRLRQPWRLVVALVLFGLGSAALYGARQPILAAVLLLALVVNRVLLIVWRQD